MFSGVKLHEPPLVLTRALERWAPLWTVSGHLGVCAHSPTAEAISGLHFGVVLGFKGVSPAWSTEAPQSPAGVAEAHPAEPSLGPTVLTEAVPADSMLPTPIEAQTSHRDLGQQQLKSDETELSK